MFRLKKLLWIIFIFCVVFFIVCDEKWYQIELKNNHIIFVDTGKKSAPVVEEQNTDEEIAQASDVLYKNSNIIRIYRGFKNPKSMRKGAWIDTWFIASLDQDQPKPNSWIITVIEDTSISDIFSSDSNSVIVEKYNLSKHTLNLHKSKIPTIYVPVDEWWSLTWEELNLVESGNVIWEPILMVKIEKYEWYPHSLNLRKWIKIEIPKIKVERYNLNDKHKLNLRKWIHIDYEILEGSSLNVEYDIYQESWSWLSDSILEDILMNDEIDVKELKSGSDEFLQKVFQVTRDTSVMNLIVENYLNEYQFINAKRFVDNLPQMYRDDLKPSLNLRLSFNSFSLSSKTTNETLASLIQTYQSKNMVSDEDINWYLWILSLMQQNYDQFFEISDNFTSENHKAFADKIQWYKDQISKQMWMPDYYFDTLVALELFNQWFFQPAKVLALSSLQQNSKYILPYQILAYANFLTNSWETSVEYLKKLVDLDPNNAEKYRFLMWIAYYRDEKYEQSVVMLSMIKDEKLRMDTHRYLINNYIKLDQKNRLISSRNKLLWYENLVASDFYTYFFEAFFHPYSEWNEFQLYALDIELANKMLRICSTTLQDQEKAVCMYWTIGRNIALWNFDGLEQYLLNLVAEYPQWYLYQALWEYYVQQWELDKAKAYLLKAISMTRKRAEIDQIRRLLQETI